jgi:hypothetical protein
VEQEQLIPLEEPEPDADVAPRPTVPGPASVSAVPPALDAKIGVSQPPADAPIAVFDIDEMPLTDNLGAEESAQALVAESDTSVLARLNEPLPKPESAEQPNIAGETELCGAPLSDAADDEVVGPVPAIVALIDADAGAEDTSDADAEVDVNACQAEDAQDGVGAGPAAEVPQRPEPAGEEPGTDVRDEVSYEPMSANSPVDPSESSGKLDGDASATEIEDVEIPADESAKPEAAFLEALAVNPQVAALDSEADDDVVGELPDEAQQAFASSEFAPAEAERDASTGEDAGHIGAGLADDLLESAEVPDDGHKVGVGGDEADELGGPFVNAGTGSGIVRKPSVYRPRLNRARARRPPAAATTGTKNFQDLDADLQVFFGPGDWGMDVCALLRLPAAADEVAILNEGKETWLGALDDQLLEPLTLADSAAALGEPLLITGADMPVRWSRSSRDLHIFGQHPTVAGFVSQARVAIGQENAVICRDGLAGAARAQILATGSADPVRIEGPGVPEGWTCWRGVRSAWPSAPAGGLQILHALDPLPAVAVELTGGLQLSRGTWLEGRPPCIRLLGLISEGDLVLIDGRAAVRDDGGAWTADGWDRVGAHRIEHGGVTAGYAIDAGVGEWDWWPAWPGATPLAGALAAANSREYFHVGPSATLIGARPGEVCGFLPAAYGICVARPDFEPMWLITAAAGMRRAKASLVGTPAGPAAPIAGPPTAIARWARAIGASGRAGTDGSAERRIWDRYVAAARTRRRQSR